MECNKEDAIKAKELAEKKMRIGDFQGARKTGAKAQRLYPSLDKITQLLTVCDVHCSAANKLYGSEMDWYGILQIERLSDELVVKKQFRKLALSLHPDKNKFPGAEAAFKLIGEANWVLSDPAKRAVYDARFGGVSRATKPKPEQPNQYTNIKKQNPTTDKTRGVPHPYQQPLKGVFWTRCPLCNMWYRYPTQYEKKVLKCQNCSQPFIAHDLGMPSGANFADVPVSKAGKAADTAGNTSGIGKDSKPQEKVNGHVDVKTGKKDGCGVSRATKPKPEQPNQYTNIKKQHPTTDKTRGVPHPYQQPLKGVFWTRCPPCNMWYRYPTQYEKKVLKCQNCSQPFIAHDLGMPSGANFADVPVAKAGKAADTAGNIYGIVGAAVAIVGLAAYRVYAARKNT